MSTSWIRTTGAWHPRGALFSPGVPARLKPWLDEPGSLTRRLRRAFRGRLQVQVLSQDWARPFADEAWRLGLRPGSRVWCREVLLGSPEGDWVFARSVIAPSALRGRYRRLRRLGGRPLGAMLFGRVPVRRGPIEVCRLGPDDGLRRRAPGEGRVWARRSVFQVGTKSLLVAEVFLSDRLPDTPGDVAAADEP